MGCGGPALLLLTEGDAAFFMNRNAGLRIFYTSHAIFRYYFVNWHKFIL